MQDVQGEYLIGQTIQRKYKIRSVIGAGGIGVVYSATHVALNRQVALKRLNDKYSGNHTFLRRFHQEAMLAAALGHHHICEVIDTGIAEDGVPYLVMPLLKGQSLASLIEAEDKLPMDRARDICIQVLCALEALHGARIIHRDLKPSNIFITRDDGSDFVKLLDLGVSKIIDSQKRAGLTASGVTLGTPHYMSPEQARGDKHIDTRVDIHAMGVTLYEMTLGQKPFPGDSYNEVFYNIITESFVPPSVKDPSYPPALEAIVLKAMAFHPKDRFQHAADMREALLNVNLFDPFATVSRQSQSTDSTASAPLPFMSPALVLAETSTPASLTISRQKFGLQKTAIIVLIVAAACIGWIVFRPASAIRIARDAAVQPVVEPLSSAKVRVPKPTLPEVSNPGNIVIHEVVPQRITSKTPSEPHTMSPPKLSVARPARPVKKPMKINTAGIPEPTEKTDDTAEDTNTRPFLEGEPGVRITTTF